MRRWTRNCPQGARCLRSLQFPGCFCPHTTQKRTLNVAWRSLPKGGANGRGPSKWEGPGQMVSGAAYPSWDTPSGWGAPSSLERITSRPGRAAGKAQVRWETWVPMSPLPPPPAGCEIPGNQRHPSAPSWVSSAVKWGNSPRPVYLTPRG